MTLLDALMAEYHMTLSQALDFPLQAALALWPAMLGRHGAHQGPDYIDRAVIAARTRARAWLERQFRIIPQEVTHGG